MLSRASAAAALLAGAVAAPGLASLPAASAARAGGTGLPAGAVRACPPAAPGYASCDLITTATGARGTPRARSAGSGAAAASTPAGLGPANLQATYNLQPGVQGMRQEVAFVTAGAYPGLAADLKTYRSQFGLAPCTTNDGCLTIENQNGGSTLPPNVISGWPQSDALGVDVISAICPNCRILVVEANTEQISDLSIAADTAATTAGVHFVDNAYGGPEISGETTYDPDFNHPGVAMVAASGDSAFGHLDYPAASPYVVSVGGTVLTQNSSGTWKDASAFAGTQSGCSQYETAKPAWQHDSTTCANRTDNDVAAAAAADTGGVPNPLFLAYCYNSGGSSCWAEGGGTAASADIISAIYALAGTPANNNPAAYPYQNDTYGLADITTGSTGTCSISYWCKAGAGYDAPTGVGAPDGVQSFTPNGYTKGPIYSSVFETCLDNANGSLTDNNPIHIWTCNGMTNNQVWYLESDGTIRIGSGQSDCIGVSGGSTANGANVILFTCDGATSQQWRLVPWPGFYTGEEAGQLVNQKSGKCLDNPSGSNGNQLVINPCKTDGFNQEFNYLPSVPTGTGEIKSVADTSKCMDNTGGKLTADNPTQIWTCNGMTDNQIWTLAASSEIKIGSAWCLAAAFNGTPNLSVQIEQCGGGNTSELWRVSSDGSIYNLEYDTCVKETSLTNGTKLLMPYGQNQLYCDGSTNDEWLEP